jgi:hypothetical protein
MPMLGISGAVNQRPLYAFMARKGTVFLHIYKLNFRTIIVSDYSLSTVSKVLILSE